MGGVEGVCEGEEDTERERDARQRDAEREEVCSGPCLPFPNLFSILSIKLTTFLIWLFDLSPLDKWI